MREATTAVSPNQRRADASIAGASAMSPGSMASWIAATVWPGMPRSQATFDRQIGQQLGQAHAQPGGGRQRLHDRVTRELAVALPLQAVDAERQAQEVALQVVWLQGCLSRQAAQMLELRIARHGMVEHGHVGHQGGQCDQCRRPGMHLVVQDPAQRIVGRQDGGGRVEGHVEMVAARCTALPSTATIPPRAEGAPDGEQR